MRNGFTLIELVMVVLILGIMAAVAIPRFVGLQDSTKVALFKGATGSLVSGLGTAYALKGGEYPTLTELVDNSYTAKDGEEQNIMDASDFELSQTSPGAGIEEVGAAPADPGEGWEAVYLYYPSETNAEYYTQIWYNEDEGRLEDGL
ncbi:MAG: type II secretion system GspH family protein [Candidatus Marinimicrobia bacterium]|nr:type II secretion system GspH family protein [Candidatus Neomarinimicrobiota bacterium]MCF7830168.1 type II secretion system GspH family protein [Candidatus Neomarinimicrobiota bacterium]MCF7882098.1 type II secretion system GspH family protein [Candidatus Neomarinimicrobiota bacterium]